MPPPPPSITRLGPSAKMHGRASMPPPPPAGDVKLQSKARMLRVLDRLNSSATQKAAAEELLIILNVSN